MKVNVNKYKYDEWHVPLSIYFDEFIVSWIFQKLYVFTITKNIFPIIFYTNLWVTIWYKFLTGIIQTIFETHQLYINMQNFIHNIRIIYIIYTYTMIPILSTFQKLYISNIQLVVPRITTWLQNYCIRDIEFLINLNS